MPDKQPQDTSFSDPALTLDDLLSRLEILKQANNIPASISLLKRILERVLPMDDPATWAAMQFALGNTLQQHLVGNSRDQLAQAIACYDAALTVYTHRETPANWAAVHQYKRSALRDLAELQEGTERLETLRAIVSCCDAVLTVCTRDVTPTNWAVAFYHKAMTLHDMAETMHGDECFKVLQEAVFCYDAALTVYTRESAPIEWATTQNSKGMSLHKLAGLFESQEQLAFLQDALVCYNSTLTVYDNVNMMVYRAAVQHNKGVVLQALAELLEGSSRQDVLQGALNCHDDAITIYSQGNDLSSWAREQGEKGNIFNELSNIFKGAKKRETLYAALDAYNAALSIYTSEATPLEWAMIQNNRGNILYSLAELLQDGERAEMLQASLACCDNALKVYTRETVPTHWATTQNTRGNTLRALAELQGGIERAETLSLSIACFDAALLEYRHEGASAQWARTRHNKGIALYIQAQMLSGMERVRVLREAIACYDDALALYTREVAPIYWAMILNNKSIVLHSLAELLGGKECIEVLRIAIACCDDALSIFTHEEVPGSWAMVQGNKGDGLHHLARWLREVERTETLYLAIRCYDAALGVYTREVASGDWARTQNNKGVALRNLARLRTGTERVDKLRAAIACYDEALLERRREVMPFDWSATQSSKGNALGDLAELLKGEEKAKTLQAALTCFEEALLERRREVSPGNWAKTQNSKGVTLRHLARLLEESEQRELLQTAIACFDGALLEYHREDAPVDWAMVQSNKGVVLSDVAEFLKSTERIKMLERAIVCFDAASLEYQRDIAPIDWALAQSNKGSVLCDWAWMLDGVERTQKLHAAISCIDASLTVYTREVLPVDHRRVAQSMGMQLFKEGNWQNAARYLSTALDALDDLFTLEVTMHGRQTTLATSADLTAHLAYALVRGDGLTNNVQAAGALERGRARATGEAVARQEAQLAAAERLAPKLLEQFREASNRLAAITLKNSSSTTLQEMMSIAGDTVETETPATPELVAIRAMNMQLTGYQEARAARATYDEVVARIRQEIPDFLHPNAVFEAAVKELKSDERLTYVATTPVGAVTLLISGSDTPLCQPIVKGWWDEQLTSSQVTQLLVGSSNAHGKVQHWNGNDGLLAVSTRRKRLQHIFGIALQTLGTPTGVLAELATHCRADRIRRLIIIPCGLLGLLPLHAAMVPCSPAGEATEPLIDVAQVSYAPSVRIWTASRRRSTDQHGEPLKALIVGDPQPQSAETPPLPGARDEAEVIRMLISQAKQNHVSTLLGEAATLSNVIDMLREHGSKFTHVHFACHGFADLTDPQASGVLLAHGTRLAMHDVLDTTVAFLAQLRLVVLSACRTALVGTELPDEAVGLPSAWLQAGAKDVLATLWPVSDSITLIFMTKFYELHLLDGLAPTEALWLAQRWLRGLPTWREDFRALGAQRAAMELAANEAIRIMTLSRGAIAFVDDGDRDDNEEESELMVWRNLDGERVTQSDDRTERQRRWATPYHWAAFAIYGA